MELFKGASGRRTCIIIIAAAAILMYLGSISGDFMRDDCDLIIENARVRSFASIPTIFLTGFIPAGRAQGLEFYRPVINLSLMLDYQIWKLEPLGYHITNLFVHAGVSVLVFLLAQVFLPTLPALAAGLLFAIHPAHTENIAWISGRTDPIAALFLLGSLLCYISFLKGRKRMLEASTALFALAVLSKEAVVLFPVVFFLFALWVEKKTLRYAALSMFPFAAVTLAYMIARSSVLGYQTARNMGDAVLGQCILEAPANFLGSLQFMFIPGAAEPTHLYYSQAAFPAWWLPAGYFAVLTALGAVVILRRGVPAVALGIVWLGVGVLPVLNIIPMPQPVFCERFVYIPSIGAALLAGWMLSRAKLKPVFALGLVTAAVVTLSAVRTAAGPNYWQTDLIFWVRCVELAPANAVYRSNLASIYLDEGEYRLAEKEYVTALLIEPVKYAEPHLGLAAIAFKTGKLEQAFEHYKAAIRIDPKAPNAYNNLGTAYASAGRYEEAEQAFKHAIKLWPSYPQAHLNLSKLYEKMGNKDAAQKERMKAFAANPTLGEVARMP